MPSSDPLDSLIDDALSSETLRPAPRGLYQRIESSLRIAAVRRAERRRIRRQIGASLAAACLLIVGLGLAVTVLNALQRVTAEFPGLIGYADYLRSFYLGTPGEMFAVTVTIVVVPAAAVTMAAAAATVRRIRSAG